MFCERLGCPVGVSRERLGCPERGGVACEYEVASCLLSPSSLHSSKQFHDDSNQSNG